MAGDWIKMRADLHTHPKVVRISSALKADRLRTIGGLHAVWCLFDAHSVDGHLDGYTTDALDDLIGWPGFARALLSVGWLEVHAESIELPRFETHNGQSAKRRAQETDRKREARKASAPDADKKRTREEKRREEKKTSSSSGKPDAPRGFEKFWSAYPRKVGKDDARRWWLKRKPDDDLLADMLAAIEDQRASPQWQRDGGQFIPHPATWLNQGRWQDEIGLAVVNGDKPWAGAI